MKKVFCILYLSLLTMSCAAPTFIVKGTVYDENNDPLPNSIVFTSQHNGVVTDSSGHYSITILKRGKTKIHFKALGYKDLEVKSSPVYSGGFLDVKM